MSRTEISWTSEVWNCVRGCRRVSPGCGGGVKGPEGQSGGCYAEAMAARIVRMGGYEWIDGAWRDDPKKKHNPTARAQADKYKPLVRIDKHGKARWTGVFAFDPDKLSEPIRRKAPSMFFVNSMSDLFGEGLTNEQIAAVFGVMVACPQHTFQVLTKRPARMVEWFRWVAAEAGAHQLCVVEAIAYPLEFDSPKGARDRLNCGPGWPWPLPNVWLGVSCERQEEADERIPLLLQCPAAVRWVSAEPLLGPVDLRLYVGPGAGVRGEYLAGTGHVRHERLSWVVWGGESGHDARPCAMEWIEDGVSQCLTAGVPPFVKQLGAHVVSEARSATPEEQAALGLSSKWMWRAGLSDRKGADMAEWPESLQVREWPAGFTPPPSKTPKSKALPVVTP